MKSISIFLFCFVLGFVGFIFIKKYMVAKQTTEIKTPLSHVIPFSLDTPPSESLKGTMTSLSGGVDFQSRSASQPAKLIKKISLLQGEELWTHEDGLITIVFPNTLTISMSPNTHLNFIQTLPTNMIIQQSGGGVMYHKLSTTTPLGVRVSHLLIQQQSGDMQVTMDDNRPIISVHVVKGSAILAFNNKDTVSNVVTVDKGTTYTFNNEHLEGDLTIDE